MGVAEAAPAAARHDRLLARGDEVGDQRVGFVVVDRGPGRHLQDEILAGLAVSPGPRAAAARRRLEVVAVLEVAQGRLPGIDAQQDRPATAAIAAVRSAARDVRLLAEGRGPVTAVAGMDPDLHAVEEHRGHSRTHPWRGRSDRSVTGCGAVLEVGERVDARAAAPDRAPPDLEVEVRARSRTLWRPCARRADPCRRAGRARRTRSTCGCTSCTAREPCAIQTWYPPPLLFQPAKVTVPPRRGEDAVARRAVDVEAVVAVVVVLADVTAGSARRSCRRSRSWAASHRSHRRRSRRRCARPAATWPWRLGLRAS